MKASTLQTFLATGLTHHAVTARKFWTTSVGDVDNIIQTAYTIGNGKQAGLPLGIPGNDIVPINHDSLWRGGPFTSRNYNGGNPKESIAHFLTGIQDNIFKNGQGDENDLYGNMDDYGSYELMANLTVSIAGVKQYSNYRRALDLETALHTVSYTANGINFNTTQFCSYPDQVCVYHIESNKLLPEVTAAITDTYRSRPKSVIECTANGTHLSGFTEANQGEGNIGMEFHALLSAVDLGRASQKCSSDGHIVIPAGKSHSVTLVLASNTQYDQKRGGADSNYSFEGTAYPAVEQAVASLRRKSYRDILSRHIKDFTSLSNLFTLDLPDPNKSAGVDTAKLLAGYTRADGDPFVEGLVIDYGKYLFISSSRPGSLPPNLQGKWAPDVNPPWSSDYHIDVNVQMNNWLTEQMGLGSITDPLFEFMTDTWVPRGTESARLIYNASGWVAFTNLNIFGHTGQGADATWSNVYHDPAWMMATVWDHYDYTRDTQWYKSTGYPLIKGIAEFWLDLLVEDKHFNDGTLVANPCNSPEHGPTTFGCAQFQQVVWEVFDHVIRDWDASGDTDTNFLERVKKTFEKLDDGVHIGKWGQIQEWKIDQDVQGDKHRHLSHLNGWYPGYVIAGKYAGNQTVYDAVVTSLISRGDGTADSNTGWEKTLRASCWARAGNVTNAYDEFKYTIDENFAPNVLSVYAPPSKVFQIDANFGQSAAGLAMLITDLPQLAGDTSTHQVTLGPAIPKQWAGGRVKGLRLRGGGSVDFSWNNDGVVDKVAVHGRSLPIKIVDKNDKILHG
ncbi:hypothetical protein NLG97_g3472 [Lecanicillium saksenae]|uniref:Uncharacterized protein n=1 Tax=Lecanicillium saksenae TaxID=468837 RepID=A0ACC1QZT3_9HYPO|nr:hypothetical protein NLG97_g3472 [Lecanicillium saksenae]